MKRPRILQALSILLTAALLSQVPVAAFAEEPSRPLAPEEIVVTAPEFPDEAQNDARIITELPDRRDAYTKQFFAATVPSKRCSTPCPCILKRRTARGSSTTTA